MKLQALRGTTDVLPQDAARWLAVESSARRLAQLYGYQEVRTPIIEDASLFLRSIGETSDIVQKEMFRFKDRGGHEIVLRPEGTAPVVRAYLESNLHKTQGFTKLFYLGPMFRAERPQAGRYRQFHQYGIEAIGSESPWVDIEAIVLCMHILRECGLKATRLWISSMGCRRDQESSAEILRRKIGLKRAKLCAECQARFERNIFRILDCKNQSCREIASKVIVSRKEKGTPSQGPFAVCVECSRHFDTVCAGLRRAGISFDDTRVFARGLDYYTRTVFEVRSGGLGAKDAVAAGGRYDRLVEEFGGPSLGAFGFAAGIERLLLAQEQQSRPPPPESKSQILYLAVTKTDIMSEALRLAHEIRSSGVETHLDFGGKSLKAQLRHADKLSCQLVAILGEHELGRGCVTLKDLKKGSQETLSIGDFARSVAKRLKPVCH